MQEIAKELKMLVDLRRNLQKSRIAFGNRLSAVANGKDTMTEQAVALTTKWYNQLYDSEEKVSEDVVEIVKAIDLPIFNHFMTLKGIKEITAAKIITEIDITRADTVSALWRYAGYGVVDGKRERPKKGEKLHYNRDLKIAVRVAVDSFLSSHSPYAEIYYAERERRLAQEGITLIHARNMAVGKTAKVMLCHLWITWRTLEGLPTREPYAIEKLGHSHYMTPQEFGWPELKSEPVEAIEP